MNDGEFERMLRELQFLFERPAVPYGSVLMNSREGVEFHRQPGGRADVQTPLMSVTPSTFSAMQPIMMAPWLDGADSEDLRRRRVHYE